MGTRTNPRHRVLYVLWATAELLLFGGLLYGWGSYIYILKEERVFADVCDSPAAGSALCGNNSSLAGQAVGSQVTTATPTTSDGGGCVGGQAPLDIPFDPSKGCPEQDDRLALCYSVGSGLYAVGVFLLGLVNLRFGTRATRLAAMVCFMVGALLTGFTSPENPWLVLPGLLLLGTGGIPLIVTSVQLSMLFETRGAIVVGVLNAALDTSSGLVPLVIKVLHDNGVRFRWSFLTLCGLHLLVLVSTFGFLPKTFLSPPSIKDSKTYVAPPDGSEGSNNSNDSNDSPGSPAEGGEKRVSLRSCLAAPKFILHVLWFALLYLKFNFFLGSVNTLLNATYSDGKVSELTSALQFCLMTAFIFSPLAGLVYDFSKRRFGANDSSRNNTHLSAVLPLALTSALGLALCMLDFARVEVVFYLAAVTVAAFRSALFVISIAYLANVFPTEYLGMMHGLMLVVGGCLSLIQYALFAWGEAAGFMQVNGLLTVTTALSLVHPVYLWWKARRHSTPDKTDVPLKPMSI